MHIVQRSSRKAAPPCDGRDAAVLGVGHCKAGAACRNERRMEGRTSQGGGTAMQDTPPYNSGMHWQTSSSQHQPRRFEQKRVPRTLQNGSKRRHYEFLNLYAEFVLPTIPSYKVVSSTVAASSTVVQTGGHFWSHVRRSITVSYQCNVVR